VEREQVAAEHDADRVAGQPERVQPSRDTDRKAEREAASG
jgi:hypothetical protein